MARTLHAPRPTACALSGVAVACFGLAATAGAWAQGQGSATVYRCPGPPVLYTDQLSAAEAKDKGCRTIEGAPVTVVQAPPPRPRVPAAVATGGSAPGAPGARVDPAEQRARDTDARRILADELWREEARLEELRKEFNNGEPERRGDERNFARYQERVAEMRATIQRKESDVAALRRELSSWPLNTKRRARAAAAAEVRAVERPAAVPRGDDFAAFDHLATMVAAVQPDGRCVHANSALENAVGVSRRNLQRANLFEFFAEAAALREHVRRVAANEVATSRFDTQLRRHAAAASSDVPVHAIVSQFDAPGAAGAVLLELIEIEQQVRQDREERAQGLAQANKELVRNLAHEIKNPLGGIRGAAQLLQMEGTSRELTEYTQVIIHEADRLQALVDRLLAPHRRAQMVGDVNIHQVCERVRSLVLAEYPRGLQVLRDYDISIPEFRGDREQLIQAVLNIVQNATQVLSERIAAAQAVIVMRTRIARQFTIGRRRWRLALELHIEDNGPGVPVALQDHIFQPLVSGREGGSGLGLTLAQTFVQQHQGSIECDSLPGRTVFKILIPLP